MKKSYDQSGLTENLKYDFKGNLLESKKQFANEYIQTIDWNIDDTDSLLQNETFKSETQYDALNRATVIHTPHNESIPESQILPAYDDGGLLKAVKAKLRGSAEETEFVSGISYNPKGQRMRIDYGNGANTKYSYDENTFRLTRLLTKRAGSEDALQDLNYNYDPVGNIVQITDNAQQTVFFGGTVVSPSQTFEYDALYRLTKATGREHASLNTNIGSAAGGSDYPMGFIQNPMPVSANDATALRNYTRLWEYDEVGNIENLIHEVNGDSSRNWTRHYGYVDGCNRLASTKVGDAAAVNYSYNQHGSMTSMPHLSSMGWNFAEQLSHVTKGTDEAYYNYDSSGQRVRKVVLKNGKREERIYLGGFEIFRRYDAGDALETERETLHIMDDTKRIAIVETLTVNNSSQLAIPETVMRYQFGNNIESATLELDENASIISYEEYYPYGETSYRAGRSTEEVSRKRYRYTGKERDEESGLYYHGARYYACWIGRWTAADPIGVGDGLNLYAYCRGNPVKLVDPSGMAGEKDDNIKSESERRMLKAIDDGDYVEFILNVPSYLIDTRTTKASDNALNEVSSWGDRTSNISKKLENKVYEAAEEKDYLAGTLYTIAYASSPENDLEGALAIAALPLMMIKTNVTKVARAFGKTDDVAKATKGTDNVADAAAKAEKGMPNPFGSKGKPDHQTKVEELAKKARDENPGMDIVREKKIQIDGSNRRPDVQVVDPITKKTVKVYEAERHPGSQRNIKREEEYKKLGMPYETHKFGGNR